MSTRGKLEVLIGDDGVTAQYSGVIKCQDITKIRFQINRAYDRYRNERSKERREEEKRKDLITEVSSDTEITKEKEVQNV